MDRPHASVVIATKNRKDDLRKAIASAVVQSINPEIIVLDDGSTDATTEMVRAEFPSVLLERSDQSRGYIVQRNRGAAIASAPIVFSIDDDAAFPSPHTLAQTLAEFDDPRIGAVAIPFINVNQSPEVLSRTLEPGGPRYVTSAYVGTAHAVRRDLFLRLGGYRSQLFHQGEESDFCVRLLNAGYVTRLGNADPIHHFESPLRDRPRLLIYGSRNNVLYAWHNVPMPHLLVHFPGTIAKSLLFGVRRGRTLRAAKGVLMGLGACLWEFQKREPVSRCAYRLSRQLRKAPMRLDAIAHLIRPDASG